MLSLSIVVALFNEEESLVELHAWITRVLQTTALSYELIFIDDGSKDNSWQIIQSLAQKDKRIKAFRFQRNYGKSAALQTGFTEAEGNVIITLDADLQDSPEEIPALYKLIAEERYDLVSGWKQKRHDPIGKTLPTKLFNAVARKISGIRLHDFNCGLKAYKKEVVKSIELYGDMHRYIPILAKAQGFDKIGEKVVKHQARKYGVSKFGWERFVNGLLDLFSVWFMTRFGKRPMHFFGMLGLCMFALSFALFTYFALDKLWIHPHAKLLATRTEFFVALVGMILGVQFFLAGFIGELVSRNAHERNHYALRDKIG
jgi:glycosyltransferase involved in cell wall biosynthesis